MPKEFRFLVFSPSESCSALAAFGMRVGRKVPQGKLSTIHINTKGDKPTAELVVETEKKGEVSLTFQEDEILAAHIAFCLGQKIPLPRKGEKVLEFLKNLVAIRIGVFPVEGQENKRPF